MIDRFFTDNKILAFIIPFIIVIITSLVFSFIYMLVKKDKIYKKDFIITLSLLPIISVCLVSITNIIIDEIIASDTQTERALTALIAGILLIRFRSKNLETEDLTYIFFMFVYSFIIGLGYIFVGLITFLIVLLLMIILNVIKILKFDDIYILKVLIPEDMAFEEELKEIFLKNTKSYNLISVKSRDMGISLLLTYQIRLDKNNIKKLIDDIKVKNGNMTINLNKRLEVDYE